MRGQSISTFVGIIIYGAMTGLALFSCSRENLPPVGSLEVFPQFGDTTLIFELNAGKSDDDRCYPKALQYRWDFEGDGIWDTEYASENQTGFQYKQPGTYTPTVEVKDIDGLCGVAKDTITVFGMNQDIDTLTDNRDGNRYRIVKVGGQWWMAENLRYGMEIPSSKEQTNNDTVEWYRLTESPDYDTVGGVYLWQEAMNYQLKNPQGICPDGWHLPTYLEWKTLFDPYPEWYWINCYGKNGFSNLHLELANVGYRQDGVFIESAAGEPKLQGIWSSSYYIDHREYHPYSCTFNFEYFLIGLDTHTTRYLSVRCVKND